jgi:hypothetical protein
MPVTWDPSNKSALVTLSDGNLTAVGDTENYNDAAVFANIAQNSGKWYWEAVILPVIIGPGVVGWAPFSEGTTNIVGTSAQAWGFSLNTNDATSYLVNGGSSSPFGPTAAVGDVAQIAVDISAGLIWFGINGTWISAGNPETGANPAGTGLSGELSPKASVYDGLSAHFSVESFTYSPPAGFSALSEILAVISGDLNAVELPDVASFTVNLHILTADIVETAIDSARFIASHVRFMDLVAIDGTDSFRGAVTHRWYAVMDADETGTDTFKAYSLTRTGDVAVAIAATTLATLTRAGVMTSNVVIAATADAGYMYSGTESCGVAIAATVAAQSALSIPCTSSILIQTFMGVEHCHLDARLVRVHAEETGIDVFGG